METHRKALAVAMIWLWVAQGVCLAGQEGAGAGPGPSRSREATASAPAGKEPLQMFPKVRIRTTLGDMVVELDRKRAPVTVENFLEYVREGFYDGTIFHRVIPGFMIQGGGFEPGMKMKTPRAPIRNEAGNGLKNLRGTIAMARTSVVDSATCQFFINVKDNPFLDHRSETPQGFGYAVFGKVVAGMDVAEKIEKVPTGARGPHRDVPIEDVVILRVDLEPPASEAH